MPPIPGGAQAENPGPRRSQATGHHACGPSAGSPLGGHQGGAQRGQRTGPAPSARAPGPREGGHGTGAGAGVSFLSSHLELSRQDPRDQLSTGPKLSPGDLAPRPPQAHTPHRPTERQRPPPGAGQPDTPLPAHPPGAPSQAELPFKVKSSHEVCGVGTAATCAVRPNIRSAHRPAATVRARQPGPRISVGSDSADKSAPARSSRRGGHRGGPGCGAATSHHPPCPSVMSAWGGTRGPRPQVPEPWGPAAPSRAVSCWWQPDADPLWAPFFSPAEEGGPLPAPWLSDRMQPEV